MLLYIVPVLFDVLLLLRHNVYKHLYKYLGQVWRENSIS